MTKRGRGLILFGIFIGFILGLVSVWLTACWKPGSDIDFLTLLAQTNGVMVTVAIALAAYKVVTAKEVEDSAQEHVGRLRRELSEEIARMHAKVDEHSNRSIKSLSFNIDSLILVTQQISRKIMRERRMANKPEFYREVIDFVNEMDKEIVAVLHMFVLAASGDCEERLSGYQRLATIKVEEVVSFFRNRIVYEDSEINRQFLAETIASMRVT